MQSKGRVKVVYTDPSNPVTWFGVTNAASFAGSPLTSIQLKPKQMNKKNL